MKRLILGRHSFASNSSDSGNDFDRELTNDGLAFARLQGEVLADKQPIIDQLFSSDAKRAKQTAIIYQDILGVKSSIGLEHFLYEHYTTQDFLNFLSTWSNNWETVLVVGHNPTLANMAARFVPNFYYSVKPGAIIVIEFNEDNWRKIEVGQGHLVEML